MWWETRKVVEFDEIVKGRGCTMVEEHRMGLEGKMLYPDQSLRGTSGEYGACSSFWICVSGKDILTETFSIRSPSVRSYCDLSRLIICFNLVRFLALRLHFIHRLIPGPTAAGAQSNILVPIFSWISARVSYEGALNYLEVQTERSRKPFTTEVAMLLVSQVRIFP